VPATLTNKKEPARGRNVLRFAGSSEYLISSEIKLFGYLDDTCTLDHILA
jgi:hypothetical protein